MNEKHSNGKDGNTQKEKIVKMVQMGLDTRDVPQGKRYHTEVEGIRRLNSSTRRLSWALDNA